MPEPSGTGTTDQNAQNAAASGSGAQGGENQGGAAAGAAAQGQSDQDKKLAAEAASWRTKFRAAEKELADLKAKQEESEASRAAASQGNDDSKSEISTLRQ